MITENGLLLIFVVVWAVLAFGWFLTAKFWLDRVFPLDATLCNDSPTDADSTSADRRDTF